MKKFWYFAHNRVMYFNYHAKVKRLIKSGQAQFYEYVDTYKGISPCLLIHMSSGEIYPIREHKFVEYLDLLMAMGVREKEKSGD